MNWNISQNYHIINPLNNRYLDIAGGNYSPQASVILYKINSGKSGNQIWIFEEKNNKFFIRSAGNSGFALALRSDGKSLTIDYFNENDSKQQWKLNFA